MLLSGFRSRVFVRRTYYDRQNLFLSILYLQLYDQRPRVCKSKNLKKKLIKCEALLKEYEEFF
jgi:hypothetical protein